MLASAVRTIPNVIRKEGGQKVAMDLFSQLAKDRIITICSGIDSVVGEIVVCQLLWYGSVEPKKPIHLYINSPGGSVPAGLAIYDTMRWIEAEKGCEVWTYCLGQAASFGAILLTGGTKGRRYITPNAEVMIHQPLTQMGEGYHQTSDVLIQAKHLERTRFKLTSILQHHTGQPFEKIMADCDRDYYMSAQEAVDYGICDQVYQGVKTDGTGQST